MGERTEMYYMPQMSPTPAHVGVERWAADRAVENIESEDGRPYFGFVSFIGPHPPFAPPIPFNRMYDPDRMPSAIRGNLETDHMDEQIPRMNELIWADDIGDARARALKARYYGEISYIDDCLGRILDAVEHRGDADNTLICFFSDHGDHMGDHHAWQKESFFEASCHIPFLLSWPKRMKAAQRREELVCLTDLFGIATHAAGATETRDGIDVLSVVQGKAPPRERLIGYYGRPGSPEIKIMLRDKQWKYIYMANGRREQLFDLTSDPNELKNLAQSNPDKAAELRELAWPSCDVLGARDALDGRGLRAFPFKDRKHYRIYQFDGSRGVAGFPDRPEDVLREWNRPTEACS